MASPLPVQPDKPPKYGTLYVNEFWTGLYPNKNPLRDAAPFLYQKFYSGARFESIIDGQNVEISPSLTPIRRYGNSLYNSQTFTGIKDFFSFRVNNFASGVESIRVVVDTATAVYDATGPSTKTLLFTKSAGAGQTTFQSVGNTLYMANGVDAKQWLWFPARANSTVYAQGSCILDASDNIQQSQGLSNQVTSTANSGTVLTVDYTGTGTVNIGDQWTFFGMTANPALNGQTVTVATTGAGTFTAAFSAASYTTLADTGIVSNQSVSGTSGSSTPSFSGTIGTAVLDGTVGWVSKGFSVRNWGIVAPTVAPLTSNVFTAIGTAWAASTYYWPNNGAIILDSNGNIQQLTTGGTTGTSVPSWSSTPGATTADSAGGGSAVWTCRGSGTRATTTAYAATTGYIAVTVTTSYYIPPSGGGGRTKGSGGYFYTITNYYFFQCTTAGTTSAIATTSIKWPTGVGGTITDGTVVWTNIGYQITRTTSATSSPAAQTKGNVGNSQAVTTVNSIVDNAGSGGGSGFTQNVTKAGTSGASHPTWAVNASNVEAVGLVTTDSGVQWTNGGQISAPNTGTWVYSFSYADSVSGHESSAAPLSAPITLAANCGIAVSGAGDPNWASDGVDTINIYRSTQGQTTPFRLIQVPAPPNGTAWSFTDGTPDPPNAGAVLNEFIEADTVGNNAPPPTGLTNLSYYLSRVWGTVGELAYYSGPATQALGVGSDSFPGLNFIEMPAFVNKIWASATGALIFTLLGVFYTQGIDGNGNPNTPVCLLEDVGLLSPNCFAVNGSTPGLLTSDQQFITLDPNAGISNLGQPIANILSGFSSSASYVTWHTQGTDQAFFVADGSTGWYRLAATSPPESGFTWSPKANIVGGCGAIKSIETTPGNKTLLVGPATSGPILKRDLTASQDNGTSYPANFILGSIVLAQPNQCAEVVSITTEAKAIGSHVAVSVLCDEIETTGSSQFVNLLQPVNDPPFLTAPLTLYPDRWYFSTAQIPAWLRHLQINFTWPSENAANELLAFSLYGAIHSE